MTIPEKWKPVAKALGIIVLGALGMTLYSLASHIYYDHRFIHALGAEIAKQQRAQLPKPAAAEAGK